jgi:hypothetical protein
MRLFEVSVSITPTGLAAFAERRSLECNADRKPFAGQCRSVRAFRDNRTIATDKAIPLLQLGCILWATITTPTARHERNHVEWRRNCIRAFDITRSLQYYCIFMNIPEHSTVFRNSLKYLNISQYMLEEKHCIPEYSRICNNILESDLPERFGISFQTIIP